MAKKKKSAVKKAGKKKAVNNTAKKITTNSAKTTPPKRKLVKTTPAKKTSAKKKLGKKKLAKKAPASTTKPSKKAKASAGGKKSASLGRPLVTADEKLFLFFREDLNARHICEFLSANTIRDLEQYSPQEIVNRLSAPIQQTVERMRKKLAEKNRHLANDDEYLRKMQASAK